MNGTIAGASYDSLLGGDDGRLWTINAHVSSDTTIERGALLAGGYDGTSVTVHAATTADTTGSDLYIAAEDAASVTVATVYGNGVFNRSAIKSAFDVGLVEGELRRQNIILTEVI